MHIINLENSKREVNMKTTWDNFKHNTCEKWVYLVSSCVELKSGLQNHLSMDVSRLWQT